MHKPTFNINIMQIPCHFANCLIFVNFLFGGILKIKNSDKEYWDILPILLKLQRVMTKYIFFHALYISEKVYI